MAIAIATTGASLDLQADAAVIQPPPAIAPAAAPPFVSLSDALVPPEPVVSAPPDGQHMGTGGTPFPDTSGAAQEIAYDAPILIGYVPRGNGQVSDGLTTYDPYAPPPVLKYDQADAPTPNMPETAPRRGDKQTMPVPRGLTPEKSPIAATVPESTQPPAAGPIRGKLGTFDLATVPFWAWLIGAAVVGARFLK